MAPVLTDDPLTVDDLLRLPKEIRSTLADVMALIYERKFTGPVTLNCHLGIPKTVSIPPPQIRLSDE